MSRTINVQMPDELHGRLVEMAADNDRSVAAEVRQNVRHACAAHEAGRAAREWQRDHKLS